MRTSSIALLLLLFCACAAPTPVVDDTPEEELPLSEPIAFEVLRDARWLALPEPDSITLRRLYTLEAFDMLMAASDRRRAFERLLKEGNAEGRLYALCGLWHIDRSGAELLLEGLSDSKAQIIVVRGLTRKRLELGQLIQSDALAGLTHERHAIRILHARRVQAYLRNRSLSRWVDAATGDDIGEVELGKAVLYQIGAAAAPELLRICGDVEGDPDQRYAAFFALSRIGPRARATVPELQRLIESTMAEDRPRLSLGAISALGGIGPWSRPALPRIKELLGSEPLDDPISRRQISAAISAIE